jgi:hypothetical protein
MSMFLAASPLEPGTTAAADSDAADGKANAGGGGDRHSRARNCEAAKMTELDALSRVYQAAFQSAALSPELIKALKIVNAKIIECVNRSQCTFANGSGATTKDGEQE